MKTTKAIALVVALGMTLVAFSSVMALWTNPFGLDGYVYEVDGTTQLTTETAATFEIMICIDEDGDGLYWPGDATDAVHTYSDAGMNGYVPISDTFINFAYYSFTMQAGQPGGYNMNYKIWVNGSAMTPSIEASQDGYCAPVGTVPQANGLYLPAQQVFTFPGTGGATSQDFQIPGAPAGVPTATATGPTGTSTDNTPDVTYTTTNSPASVDIYYWDGSTWTFYGNDADATSPYTGGVLPDGSYDWYACPGGDPAPTVVGDIEAGTYIIDTTGPDLTVTSPVDGATGVALGDDVVLTFNEAVLPASLTYTCAPDPGGWAVVWSGGNTIATLSHNNFAALTGYTFTVTAATDALGNGFTASVPNPFTFTTADPLPPETTFDTVFPATYVGVLPDDFTILATGDDTATGNSNIIAMEYQYDGGAWTAMTPVGAAAPVRQFTATIDLHNQTDGGKVINVRASDGQFDATPDTGTLTISDSTNPVADYDPASPADGSTIDPSLTATILVNYHDFRDYNPANSAYYYQENGGGPWLSGALTEVMWQMGSNMWDFSFDINAPGGVDGFVDYYFVVEDQDGNSVTSATRTQNFLTAAAGQDPYTISGYTTYYNGNAGVLEWNAAQQAYGRLDPNSPVTVTWLNSSTGGYSSITETSDANSQYSIDILNYTDGARVWVNVTSGTIQPGSPGYNSTLINVALGTSYVNPMSGVPYEVTGNGPFVTTAGVPIAMNFQVQDIGGFVCLGYFTINPATPDGPMDGWTDCPVWTDDAAFPYTFDGIGGAAVDGAYVGYAPSFTTGGLWFINMTESGLTFGDAQPYLTPWGAFNIDDGGTTIGYLNDWWNTTVTVTTGSFSWNILDGWNQICVPAEPNDLGGDAQFGAFDIEREITADLGPGVYVIADRTGGNPSAYTTWTSGDGEGAVNDFATDLVHGYWVYSPGIVGVVTVEAGNITAWGVDNVVNLVGGEWNLLGWTHNVTNGGAAGGGWFAQPTSVDIVTLTGNLGTEQVIGTWWNAGSQWYSSYVTNTFFPGMASKVWTYDTNFAYGYFVWVDSAAVMTFDTEY